MGESLLDELKRYVGFGPDDEEALRELLPIVMPHGRAVAEEFYERAARHPGAARVFSGPPQIERLKRTLSDWLASLLSGPWDDSYLERRSRIGHVHVQHELPLRYMVVAMNVVRVSLAALVEANLGDEPARRARSIDALGKILDIDLALMLESYGTATLERVRGEGEHAAIVEHGRAPIFAVGDDDRLTVWNDGCEALTGHRRDATLGRGWEGALGLLPNAGRELRAAAEVARGGGHAVPLTVEVASAGGTARLVRFQVSALGAGWSATGVDATDERSLAARARRAERVASLGTMAAGLAHELRNPLNAAHLQLAVVTRHLARITAEDATGAREGVAIAARELKRLATTVDTFLRFAKPQPLAPVRIDVRAAVEAAVAQALPAIEASGVAVSIAPGLPVHADADHDRLADAVTQLLFNAAEATGAGGSVRVAIDQTSVGPVIEVADDGPGPAADARLFEPFFTTKERGAGLGLATVERIVLDHGGRIEVERRAGWTVFAIVLPAT